MLLKHLAPSCVYSEFWTWNFFTDYKYTKDDNDFVTSSLDSGKVKNVSSFLQCESGPAPGNLLEYENSGPDPDLTRSLGDGKAHPA